MNKPLILITNDDGYNASGLTSLVESVKDLGEVFIVAPDRPQSGMGHAITVNDPLKCFPTDYFGDVKVCHPWPLFYIINIFIEKICKFLRIIIDHYTKTSIICKSLMLK